MKRVMILRHVAEEALGNLEIVLRAAGLTLDVVDCFSTGWPARREHGLRPGELAGLVVMGGTMNVDQTDRFPFLATEVEWLRAAVDAELPTLGICLGAQLLAKSQGSKVYAQSIKEIGWYEIELLDAAADDPLLGRLPRRQTVFQWHGDSFELPAGAVHLARSAACRNQTFRVGPAAYGLQFHLEITSSMVAEWLVEPQMCAEVAGLPYIDPDEIRRRTPDATARMAPLVERVFGGFAAMCRRRAGLDRSAKSAAS